MLTEEDIRELIASEVERAFARATERGTGSILRGQTKRLFETEAGPVLEASALCAEFVDEPPLHEPLGISSAPRRGTQVLLLAIGDDPTDVIAIMPSDAGCRPGDIGSGEVCYHNQHPRGPRLYLRKKAAELRACSGGAEIAVGENSIAATASALKPFVFGDGIDTPVKADQLNTLSQARTLPDTPTIADGRALLDALKNVFSAPTIKPPGVKI